MSEFDAICGIDVENHDAVAHDQTVRHVFLEGELGVGKSTANSPTRGSRA